VSIQIHIKKILLLSLGIVTGAGLLVLLIAAINKKNHKNCNGVEVTINSKNDNLFLNRQDVMAIIAPDKNNPPKGKPLASFDLNKLEILLRQNVWIKDAELYFDNKGMLRVNIGERQPVARIFTVTGNSFYIDSSGKHLPLSEKLSVKLPVYSNFPSDKMVLHGADSLLLQQIKQINRYLLSDSFWTAQIAQIDITPAYTFEMVPVIGRHIIVFGDGNDYEKKFHRLLLFYQQVAAHAGFDKYSMINVQYDNQVVGTRKGTIGKIDSLQALKNIQKLIEASHQLPVDTVSTMVDNNILTNAVSEPPLATLNEKQSNITIANQTPEVPTPSHPSSMKSHPPLPRENKPILTHEKPKPKAVMKKTTVPKR
jgi:cell division protein FtsQ